MDDPYKTRQTLIQQMKDNQDEQSWEEFLRIYRPYVYAIIRNMKISQNDVEDIIQQVMIRVWKGIAEHTPDKPFRNWLSTVTSNCVRDFIRKSMRDARRLEKAAQDQTLSYLNAIRLPEVEQIAERQWGIYLANLAMERVESNFSGRAVKVFTMWMDGVSVSEIACKMELKENSVYRLKNRVKERLAQEIEGLREELE